MRLSLSIILCVCLSVDLWADDFFSDIDTTDVEPIRDSVSKPFDLSGWWQQKAAYSLEDQQSDFSRQQAGWSRLESSLQLQADYRFNPETNVVLSGRLTHDWSPELHNAHGDWFYQMSNSEVRDREWDWRLRDSFLQSRLGSVWIKGGYQTLAWGQLDSIQISDVLSTRDQRWPGQSELEDVRLPVPALKAEFSQAEDRLILVGIVAAGSDRMPAAYADFDRMIELRSTGTTIDIDENKGFEWAFQYQRQQANVDARVSVAQVYDNMPYPDRIDYALVSGFPVISSVHFKQDRFSMVSVDGSAVFGKWLWKGEAGVQTDRKLATDLSYEAQEWLEKDRWLGGIRLERNIKNLTVITEFNATHIFDYQEELVARQWEYGGMLRFRWNGFHDQFELQSSALWSTGDNGWVLRQEGQWNYSNNWTFGLSFISYLAESTRQAFYNYRNSDVLMFDMRFHFP
ncbi:hypothetical protein [Gynuella sp.]|uniref:hypothetical protein n=1 Tax=Gynuella sp. TaxID=2969146 RepID=UPI003D12BCA4